MEKIVVKDVSIAITGIEDDDFVSLTDMARLVNNDDPRYPIQNWMRLTDTIEFIGLWEKLNNAGFNGAKFEMFKREMGKNTFVMTPSKWIDQTKAIGFRTRYGKCGGGIFAHRDIALEFASWISPEIRLYIIKEFQRLKLQESEQLEWNGKRLLTKLNYLLQTSAIKESLIPVSLTPEQIKFVYASEADALNVALFGKTAKQWREENPLLKGNIRDYAKTIELAILSNLEFLNARLIKEGLPQSKRLVILNEEANREKELFNKSLASGSEKTVG